MTANEPDPDKPRPHVPFSRPPAPATSWWKTIPGQLALVAMLVGAIVIFLGLIGAIGPYSL
jgi:hypothetical protein